MGTKSNGMSRREFVKSAGLKATSPPLGTGSLAAFLALVAMVVAGCVSPEEREGFRADAPTLLRPAARKLSGGRADDVVVEADETVADMSLTTGLVRQVAEKSRDAVVSIFVKTKTPYRLRLLPFSPFKGIRMTVPGIGLGSGFFIHPSGYIMTNNHVIEDAEEIRILTSAGTDYGVTVVARDPAYDLALLKAEAPRGYEFRVLPMGDSDAVDAGDMVIAVGNPLGLGHTVTAGIISQTYRNLAGARTTENERHIDFIQTDTAINPGSSGGPLITLTGAWVGVNTAGITQAQGIGFAVSSSQVKEFLDNVRAGKGHRETEDKPAPY
ncbi:MAG: S1C family serine protease [Planctomycetota bacterium]|jgi:S1-C subfamily serine protease